MWQALSEEELTTLAVDLTFDLLAAYYVVLNSTDSLDQPKYRHIVREVYLVLRNEIEHLMNTEAQRLMDNEALINIANKTSFAALRVYMGSIPIAGDMRLNTSRKKMVRAAYRLLKSRLVRFLRLGEVAGLCHCGLPSSFVRRMEYYCSNVCYVEKIEQDQGNGWRRLAYD